MAIIIISGSTICCHHMHPVSVGWSSIVFHWSIYGHFMLHSSLQILLELSPWCWHLVAFLCCKFQVYVLQLPNMISSGLKVIVFDSQCCQMLSREFFLAPYCWNTVRRSSNTIQSFWNLYSPFKKPVQEHSQPQLRFLNSWTAPFPIKEKILEWLIEFGVLNAALEGANSRLRDLQLRMLPCTSVIGES